MGKKTTPTQPLSDNAKLCFAVAALNDDWKDIIAYAEENGYGRQLRRESGLRERDYNAFMAGRMIPDQVQSQQLKGFAQRVSQ